MAKFTIIFDSPISEESFLNKLFPNPWDALATFLAFIVLLVVAFYFAYKPVKKLIQKRGDYVENKIKNAANECNTVKELINIIKSKRYAETRIQRILLCAMLGITKQKVAELYKVTPYIRILGMNEKGKEFLSLATYENPKLQFITSVKDFLDTNKNKQLREMLAIDILATNLYTLGFDNEPYANLDFTKKLVIM